ncbi:PREDICTED: RNA-binding protein 28 [Ceratosolen solmsi marchali]|uniref:RNA-binding protein 28 n=1 Tax=Ceratosolen solmsi marchali TaxID=326594 RepID=A0AAJ7DY79_9HYME|nr:PREDICTED: RNA-binding protein 28 [Ceratosolen solmsi marchali]
MKIMSKAYQGSTKFRNKLTRTYKYKKRTGKIKQKNKADTTNEIKKARIIIRNLSFKTTEENIRHLYEPFGDIEEIKLLKRPDGTLVGCGFVQFKNVNDASKAIFKTNKSEFLGRTISCEWSIPKSEFVQNLKVKEIKEVNENLRNESTKELDNDENLYKSKTKFSKNHERSKAELRKLQKIKKRQKRSRIIIRNLPFTASEESIKEYFTKYGNIEELKFLTKPNGTPTGCCFVQFDRVQSAAQTVHHENMKSFLGRTIIIDWAIPKNKFQTSSENANCNTEEHKDAEISIKEEETENNENEIKIKEEIDSDEERIKEEVDNTKQETDDNKRDEFSNDEDNDDVEGTDDKKNIKLEFDNESTVPHPRRISNDVNEGKTVFIKNVPFSATNEILKECMLQFGPVYYALICIDRLTEHSKGTAFVKFINIEDAEKCLAAGTELKIHDQVLDPHKALHRDEIKVKAEQKKNTVKDSRNLYLVKEGVVFAGSAAAQDVSASDMAHRLQLEQWKSQMLRNLNMFVSRVRLVIHNLPESTDDAKLRQLFKNHSNPKAVITEARVMRNLKNVDANKVGKSKEYGFVSFKLHEDALNALRSINNNPNIFSKAKRPIVAFSIENRVMVNAKKRRIENSRQRNPLYNNYDKQGEKNQVASNKVKGSKERAKRRKQSGSRRSSENAENEDVESFVGTTSKIGVNKMNSKFFLKKQAQIHNDNMKERKRRLRTTKQLIMMKKEQRLNKMNMKPKQGSKKPDADEINFNKIVKNYKNKISSAAKDLKTKWYETRGQG